MDAAEKALKEVPIFEKLIEHIKHEVQTECTSDIDRTWLNRANKAFPPRREHDARQSVKHFEEYHRLTAGVHQSQGNFSNVECQELLSDLIETVRQAIGDVNDRKQDVQYPDSNAWSIERLNERIADTPANFKAIVADCRMIFKGIENVTPKEVVSTFISLADLWIKSDYMTRHGIKVTAEYNYDHEKAYKLLGCTFTKPYVDIMMSIVHGGKTRDLYIQTPPSV